MRYFQVSTTEKDGFETQFGTNHLGHFVLVNRIASLIRAGGRLINLSSLGHRYSNVDLDDPNFERAPYDPWVAYGRSKTANILFAVAFDRRHRDQGVRASSCVCTGTTGVVFERDYTWCFKYDAKYGKRAPRRRTGSLDLARGLPRLARWPWLGADRDLDLRRVGWRDCPS